DEDRGRRCFCFIRSFLIDKNLSDSFSNFLAKQDLGGRWLPEIPEAMFVFSGEIPWCDSFANNGLTKMSFLTKEIPTKIMKKMCKKTKIYGFLFLSIIISFTIYPSFSKVFTLFAVEQDNSIESFEPKTSANEIIIITPENITYIDPMSGYYPATYGFESDDDGSDPVGWNVFEGAGYVNVKDEMNNHKNVIEMYDNDGGNHDELHNVFSLQTYGTIELWVMSDDVTDPLSIRLLDDTATSVWGDGIGWVQFWQDNIRYQDNTSTYNVKTVYDNTWYHIKIEFECTTGNYQGLAQDTWRFYVDGEQFGDFGFLNDISNVTQLYVFTRGADLNYRYYIDAVGFSWDSEYIIGDNAQEGLLLSFNTFFTPDW
ncbi:hypothetical protein LCGC14_2975820, partial [marine sediment metagenome]